MLSFSPSLSRIKAGSKSRFSMSHITLVCILCSSLQYFRREGSHLDSDENVIMHFPHRSAVDSRSFVRTCPSYLRKCEVLVDSQRPM